MINKNVVYKIRYLPLGVKGKAYTMQSGKLLPHYGSSDEWVIGCSVIPKLGGSGKTFTSKVIVNRMFESIKNLNGYGKDFKCEIVTFEFKEIAVSSDKV